MVITVRRGHAPSCSSAGSVVGLALVSVVVGAAVLNSFADRFRRRPDPDDPGAPGAPGAPEPRPPEPPAMRREDFGALLAWPEPPALLGLDAAGAAAALAMGARWVGGGEPVQGALTAPTEVHVAVTERCPVRCESCYLDAGPDRDHAEPGALLDDLRHLAELGVFEVALGGGEAPELVDPVAEAARALGLVPNLTTSGFGVTAARATRMRSLYGQVNVSLDGDAGYLGTRGWDGRALAWRAIDRLVAAGVAVGVNTVLTAAVLPELESVGRALASRGVREWQWLRYKPAGRAAAHYDARRASPEDLDALWPRLLAIEAETGLTMRIDCALVPFVAPHLPDPSALARFGVVGCGGGHSVLARGASGGWAPCSFVAAGQPGSPGEAWREDPTLLAWRQRAASPPEPCASCPVQAVCRGGCRVVAAFRTGDPLAPDPECPRVRARGGAP